MPWQNVTPMEEVHRFVALAQTDRFTQSDLCEQFGISRKTAYKHLERYAVGGLTFAIERSNRASAGDVVQGGRRRRRRVSTLD